MRFSRKKKEMIDPYTFEKCNSCDTSVKRKFLVGDYVFKTMDKCTKCKIGKMMVLKIFGEVVK